MQFSKVSELSENSHNMHILTDFNKGDFVDPTFKHDKLSFDDSDHVKPRKRGRPRLNSHDDFRELSNFSPEHNHFKHPYHLDKNSYVANYHLKYKECFPLKHQVNDSCFNDSKHDSKDTKDDYKYYKEYKDKIETDTRLTSSSDALSNFNYETIDNYENSDNCDTIDNYTSDEYSTSLNESSEFAVKENEGTFNLEEGRFTRTTSATSVLDRSSTTFDGSTCYTGSSAFDGDQFSKELTKDKDLLELKEQLLEDETDVKNQLESKSLKTTRLVPLDPDSHDSLHPLESDLDSSRPVDVDLYANKSQDPEKKNYEADNIYVISEELRQSYIRQSKLLPKIRGVWFNSTVRRMGWVGQAYKKCKRIEKIFSINKHGFEGARKLAIAFRNSQKPMSKADLHYPDVSLKDVIKPISQLRINMPRPNSNYTSTFNKTGSSNYSGSAGNYTSNVQSNDDPDASDYFPNPNQAKPLTNDSNKSLSNDLSRYRDGDDKVEPGVLHSQLSQPSLDNQEGDKDINLKSIYSGIDTYVDDFHYPVDYKEIIENYKSQLNKDEESIRDNTCREALLFMLHELSAILELDFPIPPLPKGDCKRGVNFHINFLENSANSDELLPYINSLAHYICKGITPSDMPHFQLYSLIRTLSHCEPLKMGFAS